MGGSIRGRGIAEPLLRKARRAAPLATGCLIALKPVFMAWRSAPTSATNVDRGFLDLTGQRLASREAIILELERGGRHGGQDRSNAADSDRRLTASSDRWYIASDTILMVLRQELSAWCCSIGMAIVSGGGCNGDVEQLQQQKQQWYIRMLCGYILLSVSATSHMWLLP